MGDLAPSSGPIFLGQISDILRLRGQLDEALRIRLEEGLAIDEQLGDAVKLGV